MNVPPVISQKTLNVHLSALLGHVEPFDVSFSAPPSAGFSTLGPQPVYATSPLSPTFGRVVTSQNPPRDSQSDTSETALTCVSDSPARPRVGKAALIAIQNQDVWQPAQSRNSGIRFNDNGERDAGPSQ